jgi:hypothetical protein
VSDTLPFSVNDWTVFSFQLIVGAVACASIIEANDIKGIMIAPSSRNKT